MTCRLLSECPVCEFAPGPTLSPDVAAAAAPLIDLLKAFALNDSADMVLRNKAVGAMFGVGLARGSLVEVLGVVDTIIADGNKSNFSIASFLPTLLRFSPPVPGRTGAATEYLGDL